MLISKDPSWVLKHKIMGRKWPFFAFGCSTSRPFHSILISLEGIVLLPHVSFWWHRECMPSSKETERNLSSLSLGVGTWCRLSQSIGLTVSRIAILSNCWGKKNHEKWAIFTDGSENLGRDAVTIGDVSMAQREGKICTGFSFHPASHGKTLLETRWWESGKCSLQGNTSESK